MGFSPWGHKGLDTPERLNPDVPGGKKQVPPAPTQPPPLHAVWQRWGWQLMVRFSPSPGGGFRAHSALPSVWSAWAGALPSHPKRPGVSARLA